MDQSGVSHTGAQTSIEKALEVCEALSGSTKGLSVSELAKALRLPPATAHRLLSILKRRGYVRQDEETARYTLTLKMLDLSFRLLGRSEIRLHAYPVLREYALRSLQRSFIAIPASGEVTYIWSTGPDEVAMHTAYGKDMPGHCSIYFDRAHATRRLSCLRLEKPASSSSTAGIARLGASSAPGDGSQRLICTCAPVRDYTGREVARVGLFSHAVDEAPMHDHQKEAWELARLISLRLGHWPPAPLAVTA